MILKVLRFFVQAFLTGILVFPLLAHAEVDFDGTWGLVGVSCLSYESPMFDLSSFKKLEDVRFCDHAPDEPISCHGIKERNWNIDLSTMTAKSSYDLYTEYVWNVELFSQSESGFNLTPHEDGRSAPEHKAFYSKKHELLMVRLDFGDEPHQYHISDEGNYCHYLIYSKEYRVVLNLEPQFITYKM